MLISASVTSRQIAPPGPKGAPILGNLREFRADPLRFLLKMAETYGPVSQFKLGPATVFLVNDPELIKEILVNSHQNFIKSRGLQLAKVFLGEGLLTSEGEYHRRQRRLAQPAFHKQRIRGYGEVMVDYAVRTRDGWRPGQHIEMSQEMMNVTLAIAGKTLLDADVESEAAEIGKSITELMAMFERVTTPFIRFLAKLPLPGNLRFRRAARRLDETMYRLIRERRASMLDRGDLLSMLLMAQDEEGTGGMTDQQVRDEAMTIFLAGHETTANALTWTWYQISQHPGVEQRLHAEIDSVIGRRLPTVDDFPNLRYTERVMAESMRLFPPAWTVGRQALRDFTLGDFKITAGSIILMSQWVMHHNALYFPEPFKFDPDRWTAEAREARPKFSYFPFGGGPRVCIGEGFAWLEGILVIATLAQKWRYRLIPGHEPGLRPLVTLRPRNGMPMIVEER